MNCTELQCVLPEIVDGERNREQEEHLQICPACSSLVSDLDEIVRASRDLAELDEPGPRVWNSIEIALRQEGLVREPKEPFLVPTHRHRLRWAWLLPVAAALLVAFGVTIYQRGGQVARYVPVTPVPEQQADDQQLLAAVEFQIPTDRAAYAAELRNVNAYIQDAEESAKSNPDDEDAQMYLMAAYEQKAMVYQMAIDRSLP